MYLSIIIYDLEIMIKCTSVWIFCLTIYYF